MADRRKTKCVKFGYGIVDRDGQQYWSENCVCQDKVPMLDVAQDLNEYEDEGKPYRVVTLYRRVRSTR